MNVDIEVKIEVNIEVNIEVKIDKKSMVILSKKAFLYRTLIDISKIIKKYVSIVKENYYGEYT